MQKPSPSDIETVGTQSFDALWATVITREEPIRKEDGWLTVREIAARFGIGVNAARDRMDKAIAAGKVERRDATLPSNARAAFYRPIVKHAKSTARK